MAAIHTPLVSGRTEDYPPGVPANGNGRKSKDRVARIYEQLRGARGLDDHERWQHALFFAMTPEERCHFSLKTARSAISLRRSVKKA
jgi:hypothetical protein